jgi:hypothetical protein
MKDTKATKVVKENKVFEQLIYKGKIKFIGNHIILITDMVKGRNYCQ